jgi:hypothetical protein
MFRSGASGGRTDRDFSVQEQIGLPSPGNFNVLIFGEQGGSWGQYLFIISVHCGYLRIKKKK